MKLFGDSEPGTPVEEVPELHEVTLNATSGELRRMGAFLVLCASEMDRLGEGFNHLHLAAQMKEFRDSPEFAVMRSAGGEL